MPYFLKTWLMYFETRQRVSSPNTIRDSNLPHYFHAHCASHGESDHHLLRKHHDRLISNSTRKALKHFLIHLPDKNVEEASYYLRSSLCTPEIVAKQDIVCVQVDDGWDAPSKQDIPLRIQSQRTEKDPYSQAVHFGIYLRSEPIPQKNPAPPLQILR